MSTLGYRHREESKARISASQRDAYASGRRQRDHASDVQSDIGPCDICGETKRFSLRKDHCHTTGTMRGKLCHSCNVAIGLLKDNPDLLRAAAEYIERYR